jgi:CheY-like chemotaxis protein
LTVDVPGDGLWIDVDPVRIAQVIANLLNNAAKYTPPGGRIALTARTEGGHAIVSVKDSGEGIPPEMLSRIFNLFTQLETGKRAQGGLGIGLTLARSLVEMHGGTIEAFSNGRGQGCEFVVRLPLPSPGRLRERQEQPSAPRPIPALKRVLVVDDNADAADSIGMLLRLLGAEVKVVHDGEEALRSLSSYRPNFVLLDLGMPGMSGYDVARRIRETPEMQGVTIIALTGWGQREDIKRTHEAGFDHHLVKPADVATLQGILAGDGIHGNVTRH